MTTTSSDNICDKCKKRNSTYFHLIGRVPMAVPPIDAKKPGTRQGEIVKRGELALVRKGDNGKAGDRGKKQEVVRRDDHHGRHHHHDRDHRHCREVPDPRSPRVGIHPGQIILLARRVREVRLIPFVRAAESCRVERHHGRAEHEDEGRDRRGPREEERRRRR
ncbi:hypothetical protein B0A52_10338 [Exophiala mesophila]|uniref:Uncharacterized protein n=1 Tax=Exophiala mesophila TaxID=212818 RepID=A0A438MQF1_EXOME|nr:hypothetical protein B0A52_10338 [Exophiala mesophila]